MTDQTFFGFPLNNGPEASPFNHIWLAINCNIENNHKRLSYNELRNATFMSFIMYCRKRYPMTPLLKKDISVDIFIQYINIKGKLEQINILTIISYN